VSPPRRPPRRLPRAPKPAKLHRIRLLLFSALFSTLLATAARADDRHKRFAATRTSHAPKIDGRLDDDAWREARVDDGFAQNFPDEGRPASQHTELRVLYDDDALYLAIRCWDDHPKEIVERLTRRDRDTAADKITVDISSKNDRLTAYHFDLNVSGVQADGVRFNDTDFSSDWDGLWTGEVSRDERGWSAELAIPLRTLRYDGHTSSFGFQVRRYLQRHQEVDEWALVPRTARGEVSYYGALTTLEGLRSKRLIQITPYVAGKLTIRSAQENLDGVSPSGQLGADLKVGLTSALTLDATVNPDFGQVEADQHVLNLTTFETFYPEKRPFFLEGAEIFSTPIQLFYSRRIGRAAPEPTLGAGEILNQPLPDGRIWFAAKLSGLIARRLTVAVLDALTARSDAEVAFGARRQSRLVDPITNFAVLRIKQEFLASSSIGFTATAVSRFEPAGAAAPDPGTLCPDGEAPGNGRCTHDAYGGGIDLNLKTADGKWGGFAHLLGSLRVDGPTRTLPDGTRLAPNTLGWGIATEAGKYGGKHWLFHVEYWALGPTLDLNDAGYVRQANLHHLHPYLILRSRAPLGPLLEAQISAQLVIEQSWDGAPLKRQLGLDADLRFKNFWTLYAALYYGFSHVDNREARDGAWTERPDYFYAEAVGKTDPRKRVVLEAYTGVGRNLHGFNLDANATLALRPIPAIELDVIPHVTLATGEPRWFDTVEADPTRTWFFGELDSKSFDVTLRGTYTFTPRLTLQAYAQLFVAGGHYGALSSVSAPVAPHPLLAIAAFRGIAAPPGDSPDFREGAINVNVVLRWEFRPGSTLIGVYTHGSQQTPFEPTIEGHGRLRLGRFNGGPATDVLLVKISALWG
jgi:hypothetical protein